MVKLKKGTQVQRRALDVASNYIAYGKNFRELALQFNVSKSTIHRDLSYVIPQINPYLARSVKVIIELHLAQRNANGGEGNRLRNLRMAQ